MFWVIVKQNLLNPNILHTKLVNNFKQLSIFIVHTKKWFFVVSGFECGYSDVTFE